jgi:hypothetical protein
MYRKGALNTNADALSRISSLTAEKGTTEKKRERITDETKATILYGYHNSPVGHRGKDKTFREIGERYEWPNMKREIEKYERRCKNCQLKKNSSPRRKIPMEITTAASEPFERCALDSGTKRGN